MKTAKAVAQTITLDCPNCGQPMLTPSGRVMVWWSDDFSGLETIQCRGCGEVCKFPATAVTNAATIPASPDDDFDDPIAQGCGIGARVLGWLIFVSGICQVVAS